MRMEWLEPDRVLAIEAPCKINLYLEVLGERDDGFHEIDTLMQAVSLADRIELRWSEDDAPGEDRLEVVTSDGRAAPPADPSNLVLRAASILRREAAIRGRADSARPLVARLIKRVPMGAGLGGGSSDAAATLLALNRLWQLGLEPEALASLAAELGSDVAFFLHGGLARCTGRGERIEPIPRRGTVEELRWILVCPPLHTPTGLIYEELKRLRREGKALTTSLPLPTMSHNSIWQALIRPLSELRSQSRSKSRSKSQSKSPTGEQPRTEAASPSRGDASPGRPVSGPPVHPAGGGVANRPAAEASVPGARPGAGESGSPPTDDLYFNRLEEVAFGVSPTLRRLRDDMLAEPLARVCLTGSGSTLFGLLRDPSEGEAVVGRLERRVRDAAASGAQGWSQASPWSGVRVELVSSLGPWIEDI